MWILSPFPYQNIYLPSVNSMTQENWKLCKLLLTQFFILSRSCFFAYPQIWEFLAFFTPSLLSSIYNSHTWPNADMSWLSLHTNDIPCMSQREFLILKNIPKIITWAANHTRWPTYKLSTKISLIRFHFW